jgi:3'-phosphoadenosine 5'-phosphosulfate (PAPS) 3'-phosphatase
VTSGQHNTSRALLATCVAAAARAADVIRDGAANRRSIEWETKAHADFVSAVDRDAEHAIVEIVASRHADARLLGEELSPALEGAHGLVFIADPLDGTTNFLHGFPWYAVSIAALIDGELTAGAILNAANGELFTATAGGGARMNGQPIAVSPITWPAVVGESSVRLRVCVSKSAQRSLRTTDRAPRPATRNSPPTESACMRNTDRRYPRSRRSYSNVVGGEFGTV